MKQQVSNARITLGLGPSNWNPSGENVQVTGTPGKRDLPSCSAAFVPFPEADER